MSNIYRQMAYINLSGPRSGKCCVSLLLPPKDGLIPHRPFTQNRTQTKQLGILHGLNMSNLAPPCNPRGLASCVLLEVAGLGKCRAHAEKKRPPARDVGKEKAGGNESQSKGKTTQLDVLFFLMMGQQHIPYGISQSDQIPLIWPTLKCNIVLEETPERKLA